MVSNVGFNKNAVNANLTNKNKPKQNLGFGMKVILCDEFKTALLNHPDKEKVEKFISQQEGKNWFTRLVKGIFDRSRFEISSSEFLPNQQVYYGSYSKSNLIYDRVILKSKSFGVSNLISSRMLEEKPFEHIQDLLAEAKKAYHQIRHKK